jgi:hypothetical protein
MFNECSSETYRKRRSASVDKLKCNPYRPALFSLHFSIYLVGDSESERRRLKLSERTCSLWSYVNHSEVLEKYMNPLYEPNPCVIWPSVAPVSIELWRELYLGHSDAAPWDGMLRCAQEIKDKHQTVKRMTAELHQQIRQVLEEVDLLSDDESPSSATTSCAYNRSELDEAAVHRRLSELSLEQAQNT